MRPIVVWFRRDLRIDDHAALWHASRTCAPLLPLFICDPPLIARLPSDGAVFDFQAEALRNLAVSLQSIGGDLLLRRGSAIAVHRELIRTFRPAALYFNRDYDPASAERDESVTALYRTAGIEVRSFGDLVLREPGEVLTKEGKPYVVFTPYANAWKKLPVPAPFGKPRRITVPMVSSDPIPGARELRRAVKIAEPMCQGGETRAKKRWRWFLKNGMAGYASMRNVPSIDGTSRMSPYLRFGCISVRTMYDDVRQAIADRQSGMAGGKFLDELIWREFYIAVLYHFPRLLTANFREKFDRFPWRFNEAIFGRWKAGETGYPLVDAGMRQLNRTGWMHNRVRMIVASFLTKDLMHDWRSGAKYFEEKLLDIDTASNVGGWQWAASTGVDPKPLRIFSPRRQGERYDPTGEYIRMYVPELQNVPDRYIHAPEEMPAQVQKESRCVIGREYPKPIVEHAGASALYKASFMKMKRRTIA